MLRGNTEPNYILFTLEKRDDLSLEEYTALKACAKSNGIRLKNADLLPKFICHLSNSVPWPLESVSEMEEMAEILEAACSEVRPKS